MTAGCSATPQSRKLGLKPGLTLSLDQAPAGWRLDQPVADVTVVTAPSPADVIIAFFRSAGELDRLGGLSSRIFPTGSLWVAWPRRAGGHQSDLTDTVIRDRAVTLGIVDVKVAALDADWSAQKYVWRVTHR